MCASEARRRPHSRGSRTRRAPPHVKHGSGLWGVCSRSSPWKLLFRTDSGLAPFRFQAAVPGIQWPPGVHGHPGYSKCPRAIQKGFGHA
eukprot:8009630-Alexandrium_andersonii.AAC.1